MDRALARRPWLLVHLEPNSVDPSPSSNPKGDVAPREADTCRARPSLDRPNPYPALTQPTEARSRPGQRWPLTWTHMSVTHSVSANQSLTHVTAWVFQFFFLFQKFI
jgi:hypothetical protein